MRLKNLAVAAALLIGAGVASTGPASAGGWERHHRPHGWGKAHVIRHYVYRPRYYHVYAVDPFAYRYWPRGYYPYYNSGYWQPTWYVRKRARLHYHCWTSCPPRYRYYKAWGYPKKRYHHRKWHARHHAPVAKHHW